MINQIQKLDNRAQVERTVWLGNNMILTATIQQGYALPAAPHWAVEFGHSYSVGAEVMHRQVHSFFYALTVMVGGVLGGCEACRTQRPVDQPDTSSTALSLVTSVGGLKLLRWSYPMNTHTQIAPIVRVENTDIPVTEYQSQRVITTELMAQVYGTDIKNIQMNFTRNKDRFEEGKHYFKLEGEELTHLKLVSPQINKRIRHLILWTERGAARHAKMLDTDQAWDVFDKLEETYFEPKPPQPEQGSFDDPAYLKAAREQLHHYADACIATVDASGAKAPPFPYLTDEVIGGFVAERLSSVRVLVSFDQQSQMNLMTVPRQSCIVDPDNLTNIKTFLTECVKPEYMHEILVTVSQRIERYHNYLLKTKKEN